MDEKTREPNANFDEVRRNLGTVLEKIAAYIRAQ
jgi:hypothetical protein